MADFTPEQLSHFAMLATERAERDAALRHPPGKDREDETFRLQARYYAEYITP